MTTAAPGIEQKRKFDTTQIIHAILSYELYFRLMIILFLLGIMAGVVYFVFSRATFTSTSLIKVYQFKDPATTAGAPNSDPYRLMSVLDVLNSGPNILTTARSTHRVPESMGLNELQEFLLPQAEVGVSDSTHFSVSVTSFDPTLVKEYPKALVEQYYKQRQTIRAEYRKKAIDRYLEEIVEVRQKVREQLAARLNFEENSSIAQTQMQLEQLSDVPVAIVRTKYRISEFDRIRKILDERSDSLGVIDKLALISAAQSDKNDPLKTGKMIRTSPGTSPVSFINPPASSVTEVVVQPEISENSRTTSNGMPTWEQLERERRTAEEELEVARKKFGEQHDVITGLKTKIQELNNRIDAQLVVARKAFDLKANQLKEQLVSLDGQMKSYHEATKSFDEQKTDFELLQKSQLGWDRAYEELSKQLVSLQGAGASTDVEMTFEEFTNLRDQNPVSPSKMKLLMIAVLLGLGLSLGVPFALQKLSLSVSSISQCENAAGAYAIGVIPESDHETLENINRSPLIDATVPNALLEGFRLVRSGVLIYGNPKGNKVVLVTSARPSEGKTTICANLGWAFCSAGEKTIVIDCDLRRGRLHKVTKQLMGGGLVEYLTGACDLRECIKSTTLPGLSIITRGALVAGASELLNSDRFAKLIDQLKLEYDRVVLDTPPVLGLSETSHLQRFADGVVLVTMADKTPRKDLASASDILRRLGAHVYGCVLNRVDFSQRKNIYGYYYYSTYYYSEMDPDAGVPPKNRSV